METEGSLKSEPASPPPNGHWVTIGIIVVGLAVLVVFSVLKSTLPAPFRLKACFQNAEGLRNGAEVRLAGVDIGLVRQVRAQPMEQSCPASVEMEIETPYELKIPRDSVASTAKAGLLGDTYVEIDSSHASGPAIDNGGQLPSRNIP